MLSKWKTFYLREMMTPSILGLWINPFYILRRSLWKHLRDLARPLSGQRLLDVGCGSKPYEALFQVEEYLGTDIAVSGHDHTTSKVDFFYDGTTLPLEANSIDIVFSSEVFEHVFELDNLLREIHRVLKSDGSFLFTAPFFWGEHEQPYDYARYTSFAWQDLLQRHGFEVVESRKSVRDFAAIVQLEIGYIFQHILPKQKLIRLVFTPFLIAPLTILGLILGRLAPAPGEIYANNIFLAKKR
jgi:SAM-dependent methyltransferase